MQLLIILLYSASQLYVDQLVIFVMLHKHLGNRDITERLLWLNLATLILVMCNPVSLISCLLFKFSCHIFSLHKY